MRRPILSCFFLWQVVLLLSFLSLAAGADVSGTLEINKKKFKLVHGYIDMVKPEEPVIVLSDKSLPPEQVPFLNADYAVKNKVHAVVFVIIAKDKKISNELALLYTGGDYDSPAVGYPVEIISLDLKRVDETIVEGKIKTTKPNTLGDLTYSFTAAFKLSAKAAREEAMAPKKASFKGDDSAPVKAYKDYYRAAMAGDAGTMKKYLAAKSLKDFESMDTREQGMVLEMMKMRPEMLKIAKPTIAGNEATFKAEGKEGTGLSTGTIKMQLEGGGWKVLEDKWSTIVK